MTALGRFADEVATAAPRAGEAAARDALDDDSPFDRVSDAGSAVAATWGELSARERDAVLTLAERALETGSEALRGAVATGFLEALAHAVSRGEVPGPELAEHLGTRSRAHLDAYDDWSLGRSSLEA